VNWPIGSAERFRGVYDLQHHRLHRYEREAQGQHRAPVEVSSLDDPEAREMIGEDVYAHFRDSLDIIRDAGTQFDVDEYLAGRQTPVFFGSALTNFGLEPFLEALVELAPAPQPRQSDTGIVQPTDERFTGFVFKIHANMDPRHRDRVAFVRVCSGRFTKDMVSLNSRMGKVLRASRAYRFFGRERETINVAYAATSSAWSTPVNSPSATRFIPVRRCACRGAALSRRTFRPRPPARHALQAIRRGLRQLEEEGLMQVFYVTAGGREPIVGVVGALQFDVIVSRLRSEYAVEVAIEPAAYTAARWVGQTDTPLPSPPSQSSIVTDRHGRTVVLFGTHWELEYFERQHPTVPLLQNRPLPERLFLLTVLCFVFLEQLLIECAVSAADDAA
jgi:peptide chain release factor 3